MIEMIWQGLKVLKSVLIHQQLFGGMKAYLGRKGHTATSKRQEARAKYLSGQMRVPRES